MKDTEKTHKINPEKAEEYNELFERLIYLQYTDKHLLEKLDSHLTVFNLAMERVSADGFDPLPIKEQKELAHFWYDLNSNIRVLMELVWYLNKIMKDRDYNTSKDGEYLWWKSLQNISKEMKE